MNHAPRRLEKVILQQAFAYRRLSWVERLLVQVGHWIPGPVKRVPGWKTIQEQNHRPWFPPFDQTRWQFLLEDTGQVPISALAARAAVLRRFDMRADLSADSHPVLLIRTEGEGQLAGQCHEELAARLPRVQSEWLSLCGQIPYLTHPHRMAKLIRGFLLGEETGTSREWERAERTVP